MGVALTDTLIQLADPTARRAFRSDPEAFIADRNLSPDEAKALMAGTFAAMFPLAKSTNSDDPHQQFNRYTRPKNVILLVEELVIESVVEAIVAEIVEHVVPHVIEHVVEHVVEHVNSLDVHIHVEHEHTQIAQASLGTLIVDEDGRLFSIRTKPKQ